MNVTAEIAAIVAATQFEDLPTEAIELAKPLILDSLAVSIAGAAGSLGQLTLKLGAETMRGDDATVFAAGYSSSVTSAAYINGTLAHALDHPNSSAWVSIYAALSLQMLLPAKGWLI